MAHARRRAPPVRRSGRAMRRALHRLGPARAQRLAGQGGLGGRRGQPVPALRLGRLGPRAGRLPGAPPAGHDPDRSGACPGRRRAAGPAQPSRRRPAGDDGSRTPAARDHLQLSGLQSEQPHGGGLDPADATRHPGAGGAACGLAAGTRHPGRPAALSRLRPAGHAQRHRHLQPPAHGRRRRPTSPPRTCAP